MSARPGFWAFILATGLTHSAAIGFAHPAFAADPYSSAPPAPDLAGQRAAPTGDFISQLNATSQSASNKGDFTVSGGNSATLNTGAVGGLSITNNNGITTVMSNTGNQANLSNATNVIVNLR